MSIAGSTFIARPEQRERINRILSGYGWGDVQGFRRSHLILSDGSTLCRKANGLHTSDLPLDMRIQSNCVGCVDREREINCVGGFIAKPDGTALFVPGILEEFSHGDGFENITRSLLPDRIPSHVYVASKSAHTIGSNLLIDALTSRAENGVSMKITWLPLELRGGETRLSGRILGRLPLTNWHAVSLAADAGVVGIS